MESQAPFIDVRLRTDRICFCSNQVRFSLVVFLTLHNEQSVTIAEYGGDLDVGLVNLLKSKCIECVDSTSGETVPVLDDGKNISQGKDPRANTPLFMSLQRSSANYITFTTDPRPRAYEFSFNASELQPGRKYTVRCKDLTLDWWSRRSVDSCVEHFKVHGALPPTESPPLCRSPVNEVTFECREDLSKPPRVEVCLAASSTMSLSGKPPFEFSTTFISHAAKPITVLAERDNVICINSDIEIVDSCTGTRVAPDLIDDGDIEGPWRQDDFLTLEPGREYIEKRLLRLEDGLDSLKPDNGYDLRFPETSWTWWTFDSVDEVMRYAGDRGSGSLGKALPIIISCDNEVGFRTTD